MKIIYNTLLPLKGYSAMMFFGVILARKSGRPLSPETIHHEAIHRAQARDCGGYLPYYVRYLYYCAKYGYRANPFEREAYCFQQNANYLETRRRNYWKNYRK